MLHNNINIKKPRVKIVFYQVNILLIQILEILTKVDCKISVTFFPIGRANFVILLLFFFVLKLVTNILNYDFFFLLGPYYLLKQYIDSRMTCYLFLDLFKL